MSSFPTLLSPMTERPTSRQPFNGGPVPIASLGDLGRKLQMAALTLEPAVVAHSHRMYPQATSANAGKAAIAGNATYSLDPTTDSEEEEALLSPASLYPDQPRRHVIGRLTELPSYDTIYPCPNAFLAHTKLTDRLYDPRLTPAQRSPPIYPDDDWDTCFVFGAHKLPRAMEAQRYMLWTMIRLPPLDILPEESLFAIETMSEVVLLEQHHTQDLMVVAGSFIHNMSSEAQATQTDTGRLITELPNSRLWQDLCELYMQLEHQEVVLNHIHMLLFLEKIVLPLLPAESYGTPFWRILAERHTWAEFYPLDEAIEIATIITLEAKKIHLNGEYALAVKLYAKALAYVLPWYPSHWLMSQWEARICGLGPLWAKTYLNISNCLLALNLDDDVAMVLNMIDEIKCTTNWEMAKAQWLTAQSSLSYIKRHHADDTSFNTAAAERHLHRSETYLHRPTGELSHRATFGRLYPKDFREHYFSMVAIVAGREPFYKRQESREVDMVKRWIKELHARFGVWRDERGMEDDDELAAENEGKMVERIHCGPMGY